MIPRALNAPLSWIDERSQGVGVADKPARAGHEPSQQVVSAVPVTIANAFSARLQAARKAAGLTYGALGERAGISKTHVWELAKGRVNNPTIQLTTKLAAALDCDPSWLAGWSESDALLQAIDGMGWPEINAFYAELNKGQGIREDAGGFMLRAIKALFGIKAPDQIETHRDAMRALVAQAMSAGTAKTEGLGGDSPASAVRQDAPEPSTQTHTTKKKGE